LDESLLELDIRGCIIGDLFNLREELDLEAELELELDIRGCLNIGLLDLLELLDFFEVDLEELRGSFVDLLDDKSEI
jgi:hypothetical protein